MWLGSVALSGLLLASSLPAVASTQTSAIRPETKSRLVASAIGIPETYPEAVRSQMHWISSPEVVNTLSLSEKHISGYSKPTAPESSPSSSPKPTKSTAKNMKATESVQVAAAEVSRKKVSRSDDSDVVNHALSLQGVRYVFGGSSRSGFDCSGFTQYVYRGSGISLPRTASEQFRVGSSVSRSQLRSGDLVFFSTYAPGASHVGIYIGGGRFVDASNSGVGISNLNSGYYASRYLGARRP